MSSPQDSRARRREKKRRTKKNDLWLSSRAREDKAASEPKTPPKTAT